MSPAHKSWLVLLVLITAALVGVQWSWAGDTPLPVAGEEFAALIECDPGRGVAAVVGDVAGGLVGDEVDGDVLGVEILEEIDDVAVVGHRERLAGGGRVEPSEDGGAVRAAPRQCGAEAALGASDLQSGLPQDRLSGR